MFIYCQSKNSEKLKVKMRGKRVLERLKELVNNNIEVVVILIIMYVLGFIHKIIKNIMKEKNNKKK